ncbi:MAG: molybdopterin-dependent oxidoreductase [Nitrospirae bacterium]|nr:molybdopterin-dependent oxidoreductase [Nitrospirota bacterium]
MELGLYNAEFITNKTNISIDEIKTHLKQYPPKWAEKISGIPFNKIWDLAAEFAANTPCTIITNRGISAHYNGAMTERCAYLLEAITGSIGKQGGSLLPILGKWGTDLNTFPCDNNAGARCTAPLLKDSIKRPLVYLSYGANPAYSNGNCRETIELLKDEESIPFYISVDINMSESAQLADLILPDASYLERYSAFSPLSYDFIPFIQICQPVIKPIGETRSFSDVMIAIAGHIGGDMVKAFPFKDTSQYIMESSGLTEGLKDDPYAKEYGSAFDYLKHTGIYIQGSSVRPLKSGRIEIRSKGLPILPEYLPIPQHLSKKDDELVLISYKINVHSNSLTANCKSLCEIAHGNPAWINPKTASIKGIKNGGRIKIKSAVFEIETFASPSV